MSKKRMEGGLRRNSSSDVTYAIQVCISTIKMTFQETSMVGDMSHEHTRRKEIQEYLRESYCHRIRYIAATFWSHLCGKDLWTMLPWLTQLTESQRGCLMGQVLKWWLRWWTSIWSRWSKWSYIMWETLHEKGIGKI